MRRRRSLVVAARVSLQVRQHRRVRCIVPMRRPMNGETGHGHVRHARLIVHVRHRLIRNEGLVK